MDPVTSVVVFRCLSRGVMGISLPLILILLRVSFEGILEYEYKENSEAQARLKVILNTRYNSRASSTGLARS